MLELFESARLRVTEKALSGVELLGVVDPITKAGRQDLVVELYRQWLEHNPQDPMACAIYFNLGVVLAGLDDLAGSRAALEAAIAANPDFCPPYINLGMILERCGATAEAVQTWFLLVNRLGAVNGEAISHKIMVLKQLARVLMAGGLYDAAEDVLRRSLDVNPAQPEILQHWLQLRQRQLKWPVLQPFADMTKEKLLGGFPPLTLATYTDDPLLQLAVAHENCIEIGQPETHYLDRHVRKPNRAPGDRLKVGYLSSDFRSHAVGYLASELCELHDRGKVEIFVYYCGIPQNDPTKERIRVAAEHWLDIAAMTDEQAAEQILADGIDVLVDFNGYTRDARTRMLAMRPAPVIANWLGYPGTTGSPYHNYIIADPFIIPEEYEKYYSEAVKRLPCYQPSNRMRVVSQNPVSRQDAGLPEDAIVFCSFNAPQKIMSFTWRRWMIILNNVPNSVLWLLADSGIVIPRLQELATQYGVNPERLVFAQVKPNPEHLARYPLADLFLDSLPYGAHTTASDALWMGVPVLTLAGRGFAARVCGSLVSAAGLPELVCTTEDEYILKAVSLGRDPSSLKTLRARLVSGRDTNVLFDMPGLVRSLERILAEMAEAYHQGRQPRIDLSNLSLYRQIGLELHDDNVETALIKDYDDRYLKKIEARNRLCAIREDSILWKVPFASEN